MKRKKILTSLLASSLLIISLVGCGGTKQSNTSINNKSVKESTQDENNIKILGGYLGGTYQQLIQKRGEGNDNVQEVEGRKVIDSTTYKVRMFNHNADLIFELDDSKNINSVSIHFKGITTGDLLETLKSNLGEPSEIKEDKKTESKNYKWKVDECQYELSELGDEVIISINKDSI